MWRPSYHQNRSHPASRRSVSTCVPIFVILVAQRPPTFTMDNGADQWGERDIGGQTPVTTAAIPSRRLNKRVSESISSLSRPSSPSPAPLSSLSSTSSTSSSVAAAHQSKRSTNSVAAASAAYTTVTENSSIISKIGTVARTKQAKTKKIDRMWICPKCQGDVRLPPPSVTTETNTPPIGYNGESINLKNCNGKINQEEESVKEALDLTTVMCALKCCPAPRYHVSR